MQILGLDVGTSSIKAAVLDAATCNPIAEIVHVAYPLDRPDPETATIAPDRLWSALLDAARQAVAACKASNAHASVQGIGLSYLSPALLLLDQNDKPLAPIVTHLDHRCRAEARRIEKECGAEFLASTGNRPLPGGMSAISWAYLLRQQPALRQQVRHYLHVDSWLGLRLTGNVAMDSGNACFTGLYDTMGRHGWSEHWCRYFDVSPAWLPEVVSGDATLGGLKADMAGQLGLPAGIPVKVGCPDTSSAILAVGLELGELLHVVGTTQVLAVRTLTPKPAADHLTRMLGVGEGFVHIAHNPVGGVALDWMHQLCFHDQSSQEFYASTIPQACEHPTDVELEPPYLGGDRLQIEEQRAAFRNLTIAHERIDLLAAVLKAMRLCHERAAAVLCGGKPFSRIVLTGGGADVAQRVISEYHTRPIERLDEASLRGTARLFSTSTESKPTGSAKVEGSG